MAFHIPTRSDIAYVYTSDDKTSVRRTCPRGNVALNGEGKEKKSQQQASACSRGSRKNNRFLRVGPPASVGGTDKFGRMEEREKVLYQARLIIADACH